MTMKLPSKSAWLFLTLCLAPLAHGELHAPLKPEELTNGTQTLAPLASLQKQVSQNAALLLDKKGKAVATATWVGDEGYFITKASEVSRLEECSLQWGTGPAVKIREIRRDSRDDLVLAQAINVKGVRSVEFITAKDLDYGQWLVAPTKAAELKMGVFSAQKRPIKGYGAAIGVRMDDKTPAELKGVRIIGVAEDSPAASAGLQANDIMLELAGESVGEFRRVNEIISKKQPGEEIEVKFKRGDKEDHLYVRLASRSRVLSNWDGEDFANGGISIRTDNFAEVIQHDLPLNPADMGGPLLDLQGRAVGVNIARVDRVTTFALPSEIFWPKIQKWLEADRHPPKALPAKSEKTEPTPEQPPQS